jgi:hydrogenase-1 operon protein HyaF
MTELKIYPEASAPQPKRVVEALLLEIAEHLATFAETGEGHKIDLRSLPVSEADIESLDERLGIGEVRADLAVIGRSDVWETAYAGVWRVRHYGTDDVVAADEVAITAAPEILFSHPDDIRAAAVRLRSDFASGAENTSEEGSTTSAGPQV